MGIITGILHEGTLKLAKEFFGMSILAGILLIAGGYLIMRLTEKESSSLSMHVVGLLLALLLVFGLSQIFTLSQVSLGLAIMILIFLLFFYSIPILKIKIEYKIETRNTERRLKERKEESERILKIIVKSEYIIKNLPTEIVFLYSDPIARYLHNYEILIYTKAINYEEAYNSTIKIIQEDQNASTPLKLLDGFHVEQ